jgi:tripartite-type tricarboxylate transporter receptor subunit TctC
VRQLNAAARAAVNTEEFRNRIEGEGLTVAIGSPQDLTRQIKTDEERWGKVVSQAKVTI